MPEMIDRAAIAIADKRGVTAEERTLGMMAVFRMDARAVIEAMREPTDDMIQAVARRAWHSGSGISPETVWQAAIDAALA